MNDTARRVITSCVIIALAICLCLSLVGVGGTVLSIWNRSDSPILSTQLPDQTTQATIPGESEGSAATIIPGSDARPTETSSPDQTQTQTAVTTPGSAIPPSIASQMDQIQEQVIDLRGLQPGDPVDRELLAPEQLHQRVINDFLEDYSQEESASEAISLAAFGLIEPDFDLHDFYIELFSEQVAGFYDDEAKKMYVVQGEGFRGTERLTYAHEYVHALQDQIFDLKDGLNYSDEACEEDSERCSAIQALIEGDASLLEISWLTTYATNQDLTDIQQFYNSYQSPVYDSAPAYLKEDFIFPYLSGQAFVEHLYNRGGWPEVNKAYEILPASTEQVLHPERYPGDAPIPVLLFDLSDVLGPGWQEIDKGVLGEWYTYLMLAYGQNLDARIEAGRAQAAAEGWGGDAYGVYYDDQNGDSVMMIRTIWDSENEATEFASIFEEYADARFGPTNHTDQDSLIWESPEAYTLFHHENITTTWLLAPDEAVAKLVWERLE
jgi:hypothetical protein